MEDGHSGIMTRNNAALPVVKADSQRVVDSEPLAECKSQLFFELPLAQRLPADVLMEIFKSTLDRYEIAPSPNVNRAPLLLGRICRDWREVALATPRLWTDISVGTGRRTGVALSRNPQLDANALEQWLHRSRSLPLDLWLDYYTSPSLPDDRWEDAVMLPVEQILRHSHRWRDVHAVLPSRCISQILSAFPHGVQLLEGFSLHGFQQSIGEDQVSIDLSSAFKLRTIDIEKLDFRLQFGTSILENFRSICLLEAAMTLGGLWLLLNHCPALKGVHIDLEEGDQFDADHDLYLRHLADFELDSDDNVDPGPLLDKLCLPALHSLQLRRQGAGWPPSWPHLASLLRRSQPRLNELEIGAVPMTDDNFLEILQLTPLLTRLLVDGFLLTDRAMGALTHSPSTPALCRHLTSIDFQRISKISVAIVKMILSRRKVDGRLDGDGSTEDNSRVVPLTWIALDNCSVEIDKLSGNEGIDE